MALEVTFELRYDLKDLDPSQASEASEAWVVKKLCLYVVID